MNDRTINNHINFISNPNNKNIITDSLLKQNKYQITRHFSLFHNCIDKRIAIEILIPKGIAFYIDLYDDNFMFSMYDKWDSDEVFDMKYEFKMKYDISKEEYHQNQFLYDFCSIKFKHIEKFKIIKQLL